MGECAAEWAQSLEKSALSLQVQAYIAKEIIYLTESLGNAV